MLETTLAPKIDLRIVSLEDNFVLEGEPIFTGTHDEVEAYAKKNGFIWKSVPTYLFGGYYVKGVQVLMPT